ncbi:response regulator transcription factor [Stenotrophomonas sp. SAU14A_NAIMI4_8]|uniref:response regulator transcription factor n=1 Tax=Stenotrophomonas sp. SAU14A_NAIMI4_8 TaxID=2072409 RepID=UPI000D53EE36|nr:response regulator transcription factor [Stenotrophomonas sp. SAU14A_NAIMI4_8]AWH33924.1 DNA-binding response regulator [Stenotrophomonas sp. SAU14A_NAIMI4_8]
MTLSTAHAISVALVDDHDIVRFGLGTLLSRECDLELVGSFATSTELLNALEIRVPDVLLVDLRLGEGDIDGMALISQVVQRHPGCRILVLSVDDVPANVARALQLGGTAFVNKNAAASELVLAVRQAAKGRRTLPPSLGAESPLLRTSSAEKNSTSAKPGELGARLSSREREILDDLIRGLTINEIALKHGRGQSTISSQKRTAFTKLEIRSIGELFRIKDLIGLGR